MQVGVPSPQPGRAQGVLPPPLSSLDPDTHLLSPFCLVSAGWTPRTKKIPLWPVCVPASAKSQLEAASDKIWPSRGRVGEGSQG